MNKEDIKDLIANIPEGLETETFIHGAICWAYSGRCYLSDYMAQRNANLGDCAQSCRWSYNLYAEEKNNPGELYPVEEDKNGLHPKLGRSPFASGCRIICLPDERSYHRIPSTHSILSSFWRLLSVVCSWS